MTTEKIKKCILDLTGLETRVEENSTNWMLLLGNKEPIEVGFHKKRNSTISDHTLLYSSHVKMLEAITTMLKDPDFFNNWINFQK